MKKNLDWIKNTTSSILIESLLALAIFMIISVSVAFFGIDGLKYAKNSMFKNKASEKITEYVNAVMINKNNLWTSIINNTGNGVKKVSFLNNTYVIEDGNEVINGLTVGFTIDQVERDINGVVVTSGGILDPRTRKLTVTATWTDVLENLNTLTQYYYINNWNVLSWNETTLAEFDDGTKDNTVVTQVNDGEVRLSSQFYPDWCKPTLTLTGYDLTGSALAKSIYSIPGKAFMGTGSNSSGYSFLELNITPQDPPLVVEKSTINGYKTNDVFGETNYAYLATDTNAEEVVILNLQVNPIVKIGWYNIPGNASATSVAVNGNVGYVIANNKLYSFDLTSRVGARTQLGSLTLSGTASKLMLNGNYAYISTGSSTSELEIIDISNPSNMSSVGSANTNSLSATSVFVNPGATRAYILTNYSATLKEFFVIDVTSKTGVRSVVSSFDLNMDIPSGMSLPEEDRAIVVGNGGSEQYTVIDMTSEATPIRCGGTTIATGINGVSSLVETNGKKYSYILTNDTAAEFKIIEGGPGGGGADGNGYVASGTYTSSVFDSNSLNTNYYNIEALGSLPSASGITFNYQIRGADSLNMLTNPTAWVGPTGEGSFFNMNSTYQTPSIINSKRYFQYRLYFESDTINTPLVESISLAYQN